MTWMEKAIEAASLNVANPIEYGAEEWWCAMKFLDESGIPRTLGGQTLSIVGRIRWMAEHPGQKGERYQ